MNHGEKISEIYHREILAESHRKLIGNSEISKTSSRVSNVLGKFNIPHVIVGGVAVQHYGYFRTTIDLDVVVNDIDEARDKLSMNGFREAPGTKTIVYDRKNTVPVDLLPGGKSVDPRAEVMLPIPTKVNNTPDYIDLNSLISLKLDTYKHNPKRLRDAADVAELILNNNLPLNYPVDYHVKFDYHELWNKINS